MTDKTMGAAEVKTHFLRILDEVQNCAASVTVTRRGRPIARIVPIETGQTKSLIGLTEGQIEILGDLDAPAYDKPWNAELGIVD